MKRSLPLIAACACLFGLSACGGDSAPVPTPSVGTTQPTTLSKIDTVIGTGAEATVGTTVTVSYTGWLYSSTQIGSKGTRFDSGTFSFKLVTAGTQGQVILGFNDGILGMKVGGTRTLIIPSSLGYKDQAQPGIPANSALVFDVALTGVQ